MNVAEILAFKGALVATIKPTDTMSALSELLHQRRVGAAVVSSDGKSIDGVISERDIAYGLAVHKDALHKMKVSELMTKAVITCAPADSIGKIASTMMSRNIRHLPVEDNNRLVGIVSIRDILNHRVGELQQQTAMLQSFVAHADRVPQDRE